MRSTRTWTLVLGIPGVFLSGVATILGVEHRFACSIHRRGKVLLSEWIGGNSDNLGGYEWKGVLAFRVARCLYAIQFALNTASRVRMGSTPFQLLTERAPCVVFSVLAADGPDG